jgi:hypothetical protein
VLLRLVEQTSWSRDKIDPDRGGAQTNPEHWQKMEELYHAALVSPAQSVRRCWRILIPR